MRWGGCRWVKKPMIDVSKMFASNGEPVCAGGRNRYAYAPTETFPQSVSSSIVASRFHSRGRADNYADVIQITEMIGERKDTCSTHVTFAIGSPFSSTYVSASETNLTVRTIGCMHTITSLRVRSSASDLKRIISIDPKWIMVNSQTLRDYPAANLCVSKDGYNSWLVINATLYYDWYHVIGTIY